MIKLTVCFSEVTPESSENGEFSANGIYDEIDFDHVVEIADYLESQFVNQASSSCYHQGIWYATNYEVESYETMTERQYSFHVKGLNKNQEKALYKILELRKVIL